MSNQPKKAPCSIALLAHAGMDIKSLQYLMGHSDAGVTMNVYTHATYGHAEATMQKILQFQLPEEERKSG